MSTDFFDADLKAESRAVPVPLADTVSRVGDTISSRAISRLVEQKQERSSQMAGAAQEIELLRLRQRELEQEKEKLETLARKQDAYEKSKRELVENLERSVMQLEKQGAEALRAVEVSTAVRATFVGVLGDLKAIAEDTWDPKDFEDALGHACAVVDAGGDAYKKGVAKVSALGILRAPTPITASELEPSLMPAGGRPGDFGFWIKAGFAFSLPMMAFALVCFGLWLLLSPGV